ncbi:MaoC family dehydratase N-terminal domain-containing protein [Rhodococcus sp. BP-252]|uniref:Acyl dehydratase n=1 Tax=Rhodococcoides kyotonense TaxID=398843 RepID=A0A177YEF3_9NOCA|nr:MULTISPECIES: MaoC family dehydratase N-terminal domain-containing protein [Rhodococcus]MBY6410903.1 MaoC family dehydratase N-terminal domain-containing protein [Rhodococcus sp. BP-320]MBY6415272.1 MaoC family dehydratase N-terminal domain-containing protein [Rhodococcus sp. BP-321]MBY6419887.1 MaoC family dehydratase N-terminal domain-containing protein [Rhodococcus sp. BP-324]MBY6425459.1 MaoC family dehydratase N-terminal domain-containing protein [Rhodococcus sp. BP-323]MBY6430478.1 Ma
MSTVSISPSATGHILDRVGAHHVVSFTYEIGREKIKEFARAVQDDHLTHFDDGAGRELGHDGVIAPVTFVSVIGTAVLPELFENLLIGYGIGDILHTDQQIKLHRPLRAGDVLSSDLSLESFRQSGGSDIMVTANDITDASGELVATTKTTFVARTGGNPESENFQGVLDGVLRQGG